MNLADVIAGYESFKRDYLATANGSMSAVDFWNTYNENPHDLIKNRQYVLLRDRLLGLLRACKSIDAEAFIDFPKGHPYYFIGIASYLIKDFQTAIYFFDAAVTQDLNAGVEPETNPSPATRFLMLDVSSEKQAALRLTKIAHAQVENVLNYYLNETVKDASVPILTMDDLRKDFIYYSLTSKNTGLRTLVTALITYCVEWEFRHEHFDYGVREGTSEPFFLHLFRGCVLFESLVRLNPNPSYKPTKPTLIPMLKELKTALKIDEIKRKENNQVFEFDDVLDEMQKYTKRISDAVKITAIARNTIGHNIGWDTQITQDQYRELYLIIAAACMHAIACLWKQSP